MAVPLAGPKRLAIVGATGMVGGYALRFALDDPAVGRMERARIAREADQRAGIPQAIDRIDAIVPW